MAKKTNITLKLDTDLLRRVKVIAAQKGTSVSAMLTTKLTELAEEDQAYEEAKKQVIALMKDGKAYGFVKPKSRDELHER
jgi:Family of unknown function (DUF6364)